jgi:hypothetical protein
MKLVLGLVASLLSAPALADEADDLARAYEVCLFGNYIVEARADPSDAFWRAAENCRAEAAAVPESYGDAGGEGGTGAAAVEEGVIHFVDAVLGPAL